VAENFTPLITELDEADFQKIDQSREREERRKRRQTKQKTESVWMTRAPPKIDKSSFSGQPNLGPLSLFSSSTSTEGELFSLSLWRYFIVTH